MRKLFTVLVITAALGLAACDWQTTSAIVQGVKNPVTERNLFEMNLAYAGALSAFNKMKSLCVRRVIPSTCRTYVQKGQQIIPQAESARRTAQDFIRRNPTLDASSLVNAFGTLVIAISNNAAQTQ